MGWFNADDKMHGHPKVRRAGLEAIGLWTVAGTYSCDYETYGFIPAWFVESWPRGKKLATVLIRERFWVEHEQDGEQGYMFLSWEEYQRTREEIEEARKRNRERQQAWRNRKRDSNGPDNAP